MNLYAYVKNNPTLWTDPSGLRAEFTFQDGSSRSTETVAGFFEISRGAKDGSIVDLSFPDAHGNDETQGIGWESTTNQIVWLAPSDRIFVMTDDKRYADVQEITTLLNGKFAPGAIVFFDGCETAKGERNITKHMSELFPDIQVTGHATGAISEPFFKRNLFGNDVTYKGGKVIKR